MLTGIASPDLSSIERGARPAFPKWRRLIAEAFGMPEEALFVPATEPEGQVAEAR